MKFTTPQLLLLSALTSQTLALPTQESRSLAQPNFLPLASSEDTHFLQTVSSKRDILSDIKDKIVDVFTGGDSDSSEPNKRSLTDKLSEAARLAEEAARRERERTNNQQDRGGDGSSSGGNQGGDTAGAGRRLKLAVRQQETPTGTDTTVTTTATATSTTSVVLVPEATPTPADGSGGALVVKPIADEEPLTPEQEAALGGGAVAI
ncbi:hypothetical protein QBC43DRAFT_374344 [Cladorrhinum sp. PSN259]|nr:hypothetical protein QBC43DRAFT_374344 [Cladorrhinum sp. PSN259]